MYGTHAKTQPNRRAAFATSVARDITEVRLAQRLRYRVFAEELGARVPGREQGIDCDIFDAFCDHLIVRECESGEVVGTYRLLPWARARRAGGFYSQHEFDLSGIAERLPHTVEAGRACVHPDHRGSAVLAQLWSGIIDYVQREGADYLMGCASVSLTDGGGAAHAVHQALLELGDAGPRVTPLHRYPFRPRASADAMASVEVAPLLRSYIRVGAAVCADAAWDQQFDTADFFLMLSMTGINEHYARRFAARMPAGLAPAAAGA